MTRCITTLRLRCQVYTGKRERRERVDGKERERGRQAGRQTKSRVRTQR